MGIAAADVADKLGAGRGEEELDGGGGQAATGVQSHHAQPLVILLAKVVAQKLFIFFRARSGFLDNYGPKSCF